MRISKRYLVLLIIGFSLGAYYWRVTHRGVKPHLPDETDATSDASNRPAMLVYIADEPITTEDLEFEYSLHTQGVFDSEDLTPVPDLGKQYEKKLNPLKEKLLAGMIERKLLFNYIHRDKSFSVDDPARFTRCLSEWQKTVKDAKPGLFDQADSERLKERLCERAIVDQYLKERIFNQIQITDSEIKEYYQQHKKEFVKPKRVTIRQIVLATEEDAKKAKEGLTRANFAQRARELSIAPEAVNGGLVGPFAQGEMPRFLDLAFSLAKGEIYGIIKSTYGFHIIMLEERFPKVDLSLEQARNEIISSLRREKQEEEYRKWLELATNAIPVKTPGSRL